MNRGRKTSTALGSAALALWLALPVQAEEPARVRTEQNVQAVLVGRAALEAYHRADWVTALDAFTRAETMSHSPVFLLYVARCRRNLGAWLEARELFRRVAAERLDHLAPEPWTTAVRDAAQELEELTARIPSIVLVPENAPPEITVAVDGKLLKPADAGRPIELDPGAHRVVGSSPTGTRVEREIRVEPAQRALRVTLRFPEPQRPLVRSPAAELPRAHPLRRGAYVSGGLGLVGLAVGTVAGVIAMNKAGAIKERCQGNECLSSNHAEVDKVRPYAAVATLGFTIGGVALATGTLLFALDPPWVKTAGPQRARPFLLRVRTQF